MDLLGYVPWQPYRTTSIPNISVLHADIVSGVSHQPNYDLACNENSPYHNQSDPCYGSG